jgi:hypothetical protein
MTISIEHSSDGLEKLDAFWDHLSTDPGLIPAFRVLNVDDIKYMTDTTSGTHERYSSLPLLLNHEGSQNSAHCVGSSFSSPK